MKKVALITGSSRGLGAGCAAHFARAGYRVTINCLADERLAGSVADRIAGCGGEAFCFRADVGSSAEVKAMVEETLSRWGRLDVLVNNAGITHESLLVYMKERDWDRVMRTNLKGAFNCSRAAVRWMVKQRSGHIINVSSILGFQGARGESSYAASKAALIGLTKGLAKELGGAGISVNAVIPGFMPTRMTDGLKKDTKEKVRRLSALGRFPDTDTAASFIVYLAGLETVSGQVFNLDSRIYRWA